MTYCVGMLVEEGLAMIADTRTNAGVDNISVYRKLHVFERPGERTIAVCTAGNLSVTQTALAMVREGLKNPATGEIETLETTPTMFRAAQLLGHAISQVRRDVAPSLEAECVAANASLLLGGQIAGGPMALYLIYGVGNFIECMSDTPFLQIGECKYGKPILDRALNSKTNLADATKLGLISFDSTIRSNLAVGLPLDLITIRRDMLGQSERRRIDSNDAYFRDLGRYWSEALISAYRAIPPPGWVADDLPANAAA